MDPIVTASASNRVIVVASQARRGRGRVAWVPAPASWISLGQPARFGVIPMRTVSGWG